MVVDPFEGAACATVCEDPPSPGLRKGVQGTLDFGYDPRRPSAGRRGEAHHATHARAASYGCFSELLAGGSSGRPCPIR